MRVAILGGSGLIGQALCKELIDSDHQVSVISRSPGKFFPVSGVDIVGWDARDAEGLARAFEGADAVVNLAGTNIGAGRWTAQRKAEILESRLRVGQGVFSALQTMPVKPDVLIQASAVGYYGVSGDQWVQEEDVPGNDSLASIAAQWEGSTRQVEELGLRRAVIRTGVVLTRKGGVLPLMALPVQFFAGGPLGSGKQWISWIHMRDEVRAIRYILEKPSCSGVFNLCSSNAVQQKDFSRSLAKVLKRPYWFPTPGFLLKIVLGEMSTLVLDGQRVLPRRLTDAGFQFEFDDLEKALKNLFEPG